MTTHPLSVGEVLGDCSTVIAWGYWTDDTLAVLTILPPNRRVANDANYETFLMDPETGNRWEERSFPNIVPAVDDYTDQRGMDY